MSPDDTTDSDALEEPFELELAPETRAPGDETEGSGKGFWRKLKKGLFMTHTEIIEKVDSAVRGQTTIDEDTLEYLEEVLISADLGVETSLELVDGLRTTIRKGQQSDVLKLRETLVDQMSILLLDAPQPTPRTGAPLVTLVVGVNGVGKTTSIAKLAKLSQRRGETVLLAAADTFRAAAIEQISLWGERLDLPVIKTVAGGDPAAVVFDAMAAANARKVDHVLVDTAGRLHNKEHLMQELAKIKRVVAREAEGWDLRTLLVLDATTGQNAISQARQFVQVAEVDGVLLSKLDGTAKGGMAVALSRELRLPILYLGVGETPDDLIEFRPREFAEALLG